VNDSLNEKRIRDRAVRNLRFRSKLLGAGLSLLDLFILFITILSWLSWYATTPGLSAWWQQFAAMLSTASLSALVAQVANLPGGVPWPLLVMVGLRVLFAIVKGALQLVFNYVNFKRVDRVHRAYERALQREMNGLMVRERLTPGWIDASRDRWDVSASELRRRFAKLQRWIQMYDQVPDDAPAVEKKKSKRVPADQQTVRLGEDGELVYDFEEEPQKIRANTAR